MSIEELRLYKGKPQVKKVTKRGEYDRYQFGEDEDYDDYKEIEKERPYKTKIQDFYKSGVMKRQRKFDTYRKLDMSEREDDEDVYEEKERPYKQLDIEYGKRGQRKRYRKYGDIEKYEYESTRDGREDITKEKPYLKTKKQYDKYGRLRKEKQFDEYETQVDVDYLGEGREREIERDVMLEKEKRFAGGKKYLEKGYEAVPYKGYTGQRRRDYEEKPMLRRVRAYNPRTGERIRL